MKKVFVIGDSHAAMFEGDPAKFFVVSRKSMTAYSLSTHHNHILGCLNLSLQEDETRFRKPAELETLTGQKIWFVFGEIDCHFRIVPQAKNNHRTISYVVETVVENYINYVQDLRNNYCFDISIVSVVPAQQIQGTEWDPQIRMHPWVSSMDSDRRYATELLNSTLKYKCSILHIPFIDIYHLLVDTKTGYNRPDMCRDFMHYDYIGHLIDLEHL